MLILSYGCSTPLITLLHENIPYFLMFPFFGALKVLPQSPMTAPVAVTKDYFERHPYDYQQAAWVIITDPRIIRQNLWRKNVIQRDFNFVSHALSSGVIAHDN